MTSPSEEIQQLVNRKRAAGDSIVLGHLLEEIERLDATNVPRELYQWLLDPDDPLLSMLIVQFYRRCRLPAEEVAEIAAQLKPTDDLVANELIGLWCDLSNRGEPIDTSNHVDFSNPNVARQFNPDIALTHNPNILDSFNMSQHWPVFINYIRSTKMPGGVFTDKLMAELPYDRYLDAALAMSASPGPRSRFLMMNAVLRLFNSDEFANTELWRPKLEVLENLLAEPQVPEVLMWKLELEQELARMLGTGPGEQPPSVATEAAG